MAKIMFSVDADNLVKGHFDGDCFVSARITPEQSQAVDAANDEVQEICKKASLPSVFKGIIAITGAGVPITAKVIQGLLKTRTWDEFMQELPWVFYILLGCAAVTLVILLAAVIRGKSTVYRADVQEAIEHVNRVHDASWDMLGVPSDAEWVDIFSCVYTMQNGKRVIAKNGDATYLNCKWGAFRNDGSLCIADDEIKVSIPLECITGIRKIKQRTIASKWNKDVKHNRGEYREYRISMTDKDEPIFKYYYSLDITHNGEDYELYFPPYELPVIEKLTGLRAEI